MRIDILTVFPDMLEGFFNCSMMARAQKAGLAEIHLHDIRDYTTDKHHKTDDYPFGGCAGLVMKIEPIDRLITDLKSQRNYDEVIYTSPDGEQFNQKIANSLSLLENVIILCGHYKGIDYRIREHLITREISIGDYVLTGGELAAAVMTDSIVRLIPGFYPMSSPPSPTASRTISWLRLYIHDPQNTKAGAFPMSCSQETKP